MKFRMKDIENFAATAQCPTMGEASRKLGISQPALSESIQRLESDINGILFYRSRSGIQLTPKGRAFLKKTKNLIHAAQMLDFEENSQNIFSGQSIVFGCHHTVASYSLPIAISRLKKLAPDFRIELAHDLSRNIQMEIQRGRIDIGIVVNPVPVPDLVITRLSNDTVFVWAQANQKNLDTLIFNPQLFQSQAILKKWKSAPLKTIETDSLDLICRLTAEGLGYGIIPQKAVEISIPGKMQPIHFLPSFQDEIALVHRPEFGKSKPERIFISAIRSAF